jgi:hypothetical protein
MKQMRFKLIRCGICAMWIPYSRKCSYCGAYRIVHAGRVRYFNDRLIEMLRAIPMPYSETVLDRVIKRAQAIYESETVNPYIAPKQRPNWRMVKKLMESGATREQANRLATK